MKKLSFSVLICGTLIATNGWASSLMPTCDDELLRDFILEMVDEEVGTQLGIQLASGVIKRGIKTTETNADKSFIVCDR